VGVGDGAVDCDWNSDVVVLHDGQHRVIVQLAADDKMDRRRGVAARAI
jgi:hypothetical protein